MTIKLGSFVIIDPYNNNTIGVGMIDHALRRSSNISWHEMSINKKTRSKLNEQKPCVDMVYWIIRFRQINNC